MAYDRFLIAPFKSGLQTDLKPWLTPEDSFELLKNACVFRGRVKKRFGGTWFGTTQQSSRLTVNLGTTNGSGNLSGMVPGYSGSYGAIGQQFAIGNEIFTVNALGTPMTLLSTGATPTKTFNTTSGAFSFAGAAATTPVYWYPARPVMGLTLYEAGTINEHVAYAFDTRFAYKFSGGRFFKESGPIFHGDDDDFFWASNWRGVQASDTALFVANFSVATGSAAAAVTDDPIWWYNGSTWAPFSYSPDATINPANQQPYTVTRTTSSAGTTIASYIQSARIILPFKDRLIMLNTIENNANGATTFPSSLTPANYLGSTNTQYVNRCRFSHNGSPFADNAWLEPNQRINKGSLQVADGGGFLDAPTEEAIVGAEFIKDRLIVYFERSTWELAYTGNQVLPFVWQQLNSGLGSQATFSTIQFDTAILAIGNTGVHACNGSNVERIDNKIPNEIFTIDEQTAGVSRIQGIRDYYEEMVYWSFPSDTGSTYPDKLLIYNYRNETWAIYDDSITAFGYFEQQDGLTWATWQSTWAQSNFTWASGLESARARQVIAGNQQGYVWRIKPGIDRNPAVLQITDMTASGSVTNLVIMQHNLTSGDYIYLENCNGTSGFSDTIMQVTVVDANNVTVMQSFSGTYTGNGTATRVTPPDILSKRWNPYIGQGRTLYLSKIDFCVQKTSDGELTVDYYPSSSRFSMVEEGQDTGMLMGTGVLETYPYALYPFEQEQDTLWHPVYFQTDGQFIQIRLYYSPAQITDPAIAHAPFVLEGLILQTQATGSRLQ